MTTPRFRFTTCAVGFILVFAVEVPRMFAQENASSANEFFALSRAYDPAVPNNDSLAQFHLRGLRAGSYYAPVDARSETSGTEEAPTRESAPLRPANFQSNVAPRPPIMPPTDVRFEHGSGDRLFRALGFGLFLASGADAASTEIALGRPGLAEINPTQQTRALRMGSHVAAPAFMWWASEQVHRGGKPKLALLMRIGFSVAYGYAVMHNVRTMNRLPQY